MYYSGRTHETAVARGHHIGDGNYITSRGGKISGNESHIASHGVSACNNDNWRTRANNKPLTIIRKGK